MYKKQGEIHSSKLQQMAALQKDTAWDNRLAITVQAMFTPSCTLRFLSETLHSTHRHFAGHSIGFIDSIRHSLLAIRLGSHSISLGFVSYQPYLYHCHSLEELSVCKKKRALVWGPWTLAYVWTGVFPSLSS